MRKFWFVFKREYMVRVRTRAFLLGTVGLPLLLAAAFVVPAFFASRHTGHTLRIVIVDQAGGLAPLIERNLQYVTLPNRRPQFQVVGNIERPANASETTEELRRQVLAGNLDGYLWVPATVLSGDKAEFHTLNPGDFTLTDDISSAVTQAAIGGRLRQQDAHVEDLDKLLTLVKISVIKIGERGETVERGQTFQGAILLAVVLYTSLLMYGIATMRSVLEEKSTRIIEILLSSVRPFSLLAGKIVGVGAVGFTQFLIWGVAGALIVGYGSMSAVLSRPNGGIHLRFPTILWLWFVLFFLGGYFLYASLYAAVGAAVSNEQDANQVQLPITIVLVLCFTMFPVLLRSPASHVAFVLTMIPFFSPILMILRIALETPPLWQILLSFGLLVVATIGVVYVSAKIYRVGVLMSGKRPSLIEMVRWLRYT